MVYCVTFILLSGYRLQCHRKEKKRKEKGEKHQVRIHTLGRRRILDEITYSSKFAYNACNIDIAHPHLQEYKIKTNSLVLQPEVKLIQYSTSNANVYCNTSFYCGIVSPTAEKSILVKLLKSTCFPKVAQTHTQKTISSSRSTFLGK